MRTEKPATPHRRTRARLASAFTAACLCTSAVGLFGAAPAGAQNPAPLQALALHYNPNGAAVAAVPALTHVADIAEYGLVTSIVLFMVSIVKPEPQ